MVVCRSCCCRVHVWTSEARGLGRYQCDRLPAGRAATHRHLECVAPRLGAGSRHAAAFHRPLCGARRCSGARPRRRDHLAPCQRDQQCQRGCVRYGCRGGPCAVDPPRRERGGTGIRSQPRRRTGAPLHRRRARPEVRSRHGPARGAGLRQCPGHGGVTPFRARHYWSERCDRGCAVLRCGGLCAASQATPPRCHQGQRRPCCRAAAGGGRGGGPNEVASRTSPAGEQPPRQRCRRERGGGWRRIPSACARGSASGCRRGGTPQSRGARAAPRRCRERGSSASSVSRQCC